VFGCGVVELGRVLLLRCAPELDRSAAKWRRNGGGKMSKHICRRRREDRKSQRTGRVPGQRVQALTAVCGHGKRQRAMSLDMALAQKAGEMSSADVRLVSSEPIKTQRHRQQTDRQAHERCKRHRQQTERQVETGTRAHSESLIKMMADEQKVKVLPMFDTLC